MVLLAGDTWLVPHMRRTFFEELRTQLLTNRHDPVARTHVPEILMITGTIRRADRASRARRPRNGNHGFNGLEWQRR
jgi:hypothetical protein